VHRVAILSLFVVVAQNRIENAPIASEATETSPASTAWQEMVTKDCRFSIIVTKSKVIEDDLPLL